MTNNKLNINKKTRNSNICFGIGLIALDVILNGNPLSKPKLLAGGSCANVLTILSYLGWDSFPIARLSKNNGTKFLINDLKANGVKVDLITRTDDGSTPVIIHRILKDKNNQPKHRFEFKVPKTGQWLPSYKPVLANRVENITAFDIIPTVFYLDRVSRANIDLARHYKNMGALIFFEPSSISDDKQFKECLAISDIIKFSSDRIPNYKATFEEKQSLLEIETLGSGGLQYRTANQKSNSWKTIHAPKIDNLLDTAGAGDWCSAGIISILSSCFSARKSFTIKDVETAIRYGQFIAALNCCFFGARGLMYNLQSGEIQLLFTNYKSNKKISLSITEQSFGLQKQPFDFKTIL